MREIESLPIGLTDRLSALHLFIDESGTFVRAPNKPGISLVGALVIPDERRARIEKKCLAMRPRLPMERGEVKGQAAWRGADPSGS